MLRYDRVFETLTLGIKELGALDSNDLTDEELAEAAVELDKQRNAFAAAEAHLLRAFNVRGVYAPTAPSPGRRGLRGGPVPPKASAPAGCGWDVSWKNC